MKLFFWILTRSSGATWSFIHGCDVALHESLLGICKVFASHTTDGPLTEDALRGLLGEASLSVVASVRVAVFRRRLGIVIAIEPLAISLEDTLLRVMSIRDPTAATAFLACPPAIQPFRVFFSGGGKVYFFWKERKWLWASRRFER